MYHLFEHLAKFTIASGKSQRCDDFVDRLNRRYTICMLLICCALISSKQYVGDPLSCFCPSHFTGAHVEYTNNVCWISNSYYVPLEGDFTHNSELYTNVLDDAPNSQIKVVRVSNLIAYYPFVLLIQAMFFYLPYFFWKNVVCRSAYDISTLVNFARDSEAQGVRDHALKYVIRHIERASGYYTIKRQLLGQKILPNDTREPEMRRSVPARSKSGHLVNRAAKAKSEYFDYDVNENEADEAKKAHSNDDLNASILSSKFSMDKKAHVRPNVHYEINRTPVTHKHHSNIFQQIYAASSTYHKFLFTVYLITKVLYIVNCFGQLLVLNRLMTGDDRATYQSVAPAHAVNEPSYHSFNTHREAFRDGSAALSGSGSSYVSLVKANFLLGFEFGYRSLVNLVQTGSLFGSKTRLLIFHSVIFCDFKIRTLGDRLHKHTVQCVVPINIFSEKIFTLLWFWLLVLTLVNVYNLIDWLLFYFSKTVRFNYMKRFLVSARKRTQAPLGAAKGAKTPSDKITYKSFAFDGDVDEVRESGAASSHKDVYKKKFLKLIIERHLQLDYLFVLRIIAKNTNEIVSQELVNHLIDHYQNNNRTTPLLSMQQKPSVNL